MPSSQRPLMRFDMDFKIRSAVADFDSHVDRYRRVSLDARRLLRSQLDIPYGPTMLQRVDVFLPAGGSVDRPLNIFFHGGYWRAFDKGDYSFLAENIVASNAVAVIANYDLMPSVSMAELLAECRSAVRWCYDNATRFGASPKRISVSGHSAGGHIAAILCLTPWSEYGLPVDVIKSTTIVSGIFDLTPILESFLADETGLTPEDAAEFSPISWVESVNRELGGITLACGMLETQEFHRQTDAFADKLRAVGVSVDVLKILRRHHMDIVFDLGDGACELGRRHIDMVHAVWNRY